MSIDAHKQKSIDEKEDREDQAEAAERIAAREEDGKTPQTVHEHGRDYVAYPQT